MTEREQLLGLKPQQALAVVAAALAAVVVLMGRGAHEPIRYLVQAIPVMAAALIAWRSPALSRWALAPVLLFWLFVSLAVWFYLLGGPSPVTGHFSFAERLLAGLLGLFAAMGFSLFFWIRSEARIWLGLAVAALFAGAQVWAYLLSSPPT